MHHHENKGQQDTLEDKRPFNKAQFLFANKRENTHLVSVCVMCDSFENHVAK